MPRCRFHKDCRSKTVLYFFRDRQTHEDKLSGEDKFNRTTKTGQLKTYETDQPNLARDRQCQTMRRRHPTPTKPRTNEQETANIRIQRRLHVRRRMCGDFGLSQLPASPRNQRPPGQNGLQSQRQRRSNRNDDLPTILCILACVCCRADSAPCRSLWRHDSPVVVNTDLPVISMPNCALMEGQSHGQDLDGPVVRCADEMFSRNFTLVRTCCSASRQRSASLDSSVNRCPVASKPRAALAPCFCDVQRET